VAAVAVVEVVVLEVVAVADGVTVVGVEVGAAEVFITVDTGVVEVTGITITATVCMLTTVEVGVEAVDGDIRGMVMAMVMITIAILMNMVQCNAHGTRCFKPIFYFLPCQLL
jgi:hypothetical protein